MCKLLLQYVSITHVHIAPPWPLDQEGLKTVGLFTELESGWWEFPSPSLDFNTMIKTQHSLLEGSLPNLKVSTILPPIQQQKCIHDRQHSFCWINTHAR